MNNWMEALQREFDAEDESFLIQIRINLTWDEDAFLRLVMLMRECCLHSNQEQQLERWLCQGFWYVEQFTRDWTNHPNFPRPSSQYHKLALELLFCLSDAFFFADPLAEVDRRIAELRSFSAKQ